jgi:hypothetical protein
MLAVWSHSVVRSIVEWVCDFFRGEVVILVDSVFMSIDDALINRSYGPFASLFLMTLKEWI